MKNISLYAIIILLVACIALGAVIYFKNNQIEECRQKEIVIKNEKLNKVRDSIINIYQLTLDKYQKEVDSLKTVSKKVIYVPYEKKYYINRDVDTALDIIADYKYDTSSKRTSQ